MVRGDGHGEALLESQMLRVKRFGGNSMVVRTLPIVVLGVVVEERTDRGGREEDGKGG